MEKQGMGMIDDKDFVVGRWIVSPRTWGYGYQPTLYASEITAVTPKLVKHGRRNQTKKEDVLLVFSSRDEAMKIVEKSNGIAGEMTRRQRAATDWAKAEIAKLVSANRG